MEIKQIPFHIYEKEAHMKIKQFPHPFFLYIYSHESQVTINVFLEWFTDNYKKII